MISREDIIAAALKLLGPSRSVSTLSLREVAREAGIAPNSFYRHFRDMDELAVALIDMAGESLRQIIGDDRLLHILVREGTVGSDAFKHAVERQLSFFEEELGQDLIRLAALKGSGLYQPALTAKAITRLVFTMGATVLDLPREKQDELAAQIVKMVRIIIAGTQTLAIFDSKPKD